MSSKTVPQISQNNSMHTYFQLLTTLHSSTKYNILRYYKRLNDALVNAPASQVTLRLDLAKSLDGLKKKVK